LLALAVIALPLALYSFWLAVGNQPACSISTVTSRTAGATKTVTTKNCQMPGMAYYVLVLGVVGILLWPDVKSFGIGVLSLTKADIGSAAKIVTDAITGDVQAGSQPAEQVFSDVLRNQ
jgi:hypothetical protein